MVDIEEATDRAANFILVPAKSGIRNADLYPREESQQRGKDEAVEGPFACDPSPRTSLQV